MPGAPSAGTADGHAAAAALASLAGMTPIRLARILDGMSPPAAWDALADGRHPADPDRRFAAVTAAVDPGTSFDRCRQAGIEVLLPSDPGYPDRLRTDPGRPAVLFGAGAPRAAHAGPAVAIVGARSATPYGRQVAAELGRDLTAAGVTVVSGLALGIDAAAHAGVLAAPPVGAAAPVGVAGTGLDVVYPPSNARLWAEVRARGVIFSEAPPGATPRPRLFPARNRIIASLSDVVVVVECHPGGGALTTAEAAARRGIPVCAVPGSVRSPASWATNGLLVDGCAPVRDVQDVLVAVALARAGRDGPVPAQRVGMFPAAKGRDRVTGRVPADTGPRRRVAGTRRSSPGDGDRAEGAGVSPGAAVVADAVDDTPTSAETIVLRTGMALPEVVQACGQLVAAGALRSGAGWWCRR